ncbi:hypothetical protein BOTBODRAFT_169586 [Botryobasidium botryosum FD-172 SS1]|uniref:Transmembrane protein n=1 Tax=Botryobasidium botryosum (strain FD-172 SS1) TaxID=930990 RepID=A0A067MZ62_BOTB1|nr:hypothetical protein BOTBODRAFT_169586 [Botryobasidium botryosum FD-172 SS1]
MTATLRNITIDDNDPKIVYTGAWEPGSLHPSVQDYGGGHATSSDPNARASFTFTGVAVYYLSPLWPYTVNTKLTLDDTTPVNVDLTDHTGAGTVVGGGDETVAWHVIYGFTNLTNTTHTLVISPDTQFTIVDGLIYTVADTTTSSTTSPQTATSSSSSSSASSTTNPTPSKTNNIAIGVGTGVGVLALLIALLALCLLCRDRRRRRLGQDPSAPSPMPSPYMMPTAFHTPPQAPAQVPLAGGYSNDSRTGAPLVYDPWTPYVDTPRASINARAQSQGVEFTPNSGSIEPWSPPTTIASASSARASKAASMSPMSFAWRSSGTEAERSSGTAPSSFTVANTNSINGAAYHSQLIRAQEQEGLLQDRLGSPAPPSYREEY